MSEGEYSESGKFCAELDRGVERPDGVREAVRIEVGKYAAVNAVLEKMRVKDFYYLYNTFKVVATQLLGAGRITFGVPLSRERAAELIGQCVIPYFSCLQDRAEDDDHKQQVIMRYGILIAMSMDAVVGIFVEACHDAEIDFVRGGVRDAVC